MQALLEDVFAITGVKAKEKGIEFTCVVAPDVPRALVADADSIGQVLANLCANAVKFTDRGSIGVSVRAASSDDKTITLAFAVEDTGIGMSEAQLASLYI